MSDYDFVTEMIAVLEEKATALAKGIVPRLSSNRDDAVALGIVLDKLAQLRSGSVTP